MKKLIIIMLALFAFSTINAQNVQWYKTTELAVKTKVYNSYYGRYEWTPWSDWKECVCAVKFDLTNDVITIYSASTQVYKILYTLEPPIDNSGTQVQFKIRDQDGDYGELRLRVENNGNSQIYIDFANVMWVYNVVRTR